jgi:hypothetical protein
MVTMDLHKFEERTSQEEASGKEKPTPRPGYQTPEPGAPLVATSAGIVEVKSFHRLPCQQTSDH